MKHFCFKLKAGGLAILMTMVPSVPADDSHTVSGDRATDRVVDVLAVCPMGLATTAIGAVLTVVALPFTLPSGSVKDSARMMVVNPA